MRDTDLEVWYVKPAVKATTARVVNPTKRRKRERVGGVCEGRDAASVSLIVIS